MRDVIRLSLAVGLCLLPRPSAAAEALVAVATNFATVLAELTTAFEAATPYSVRITTGSSGKLYAQIVAGAPFDVLLSADQERPQRLEAEGLAVTGSRFTYAFGSLALWSADPQRIGPDGAALLREGRFRRLAIANPDLAPYGAAARQALEALGVWAALQGRVVMGENIGQAYAMVATGNAELGVVALSQLFDPARAPAGSSWVIPPSLYEPIRQDVVLLKQGADNPAAAAFVDFLRSDAARQLIEAMGYAVEATGDSGN